MIGQYSVYPKKAGYTVTPVVCGWAGAVFESLKHLDRSLETKYCKNKKKII